MSGEGRARAAMRTASYLAGVLLLSLAFSVRASAMDFDAEALYRSVFVIFADGNFGSGFAVGEHTIVTNAHVVDDANRVRVYDYEGDDRFAEVLFRDADSDMAVLFVDGETLAPLAMADETSAKIGADVYAIGAPERMTYSLTKGILSAKERRIAGDTYLQIDAPLNPGNSGGPLLDGEGRVLGMNTMKLSEGIGLAIPATRIIAFFTDNGFDVDEAGNISGDPPSPAATPAPKPGDANADRVGEELRYANNRLFALLVLSGLLNAILLTALIAIWTGRKRSAPPDPRERTDFEIEIGE
jgi:serine protease Do